MVWIEAGGDLHPSPPRQSLPKPRPGASGAFVCVATVMTARPFPPPWTADDNGSCFIVRDHNGQALAYVYFEEEAGRRAAAKLLTRDEARRIAVSISRLPDLLRRPQY